MSPDEIWEILSLRNYNTRLVVLSTSILGVAAGLVGSFLLLRKRSLMGDALSHATLPGIALAFGIMASLGFDGKSLPVLTRGGHHLRSVGSAPDAGHSPHHPPA